MKICLSCEGVTDTPAQRCGNCQAPLVPTDAVHYPARRGELDAGNPLLGSVLDGKYRLQSVLGRGGLGTVFRAQHVGSLVSVAVKLLHPRYSERPEYRSALLPEARRAAAVVHEHCARLLDVGEGDEGVTYLAMELVEGQTLEEVMQQGPLSTSHALDILVQVADALVAVHDAELVHCDLSPRNVMVTPRAGRLDVKVLDFGIARSVSIAGRQSTKSQLWGFANPIFSAPELLRGEAVDQRADIYSFGTLAWLLLTGSLPVGDADVERAVAAVREGRLQPWPRGPRVPGAVRRLVQSCVRFDREQRPATMHDVHHRLVALRTGRLPAVVRATAIAAGLGVVLTIAAEPTAAPPRFLRPQPGAALSLTDGSLALDAAVRDLRAVDLEVVLCHFGGFEPARLRCELAREGVRLRQVELHPEIDEAGTLVLSSAQEGWRAVVDALVELSRNGPVDLAFVVPGAALLGASRVRVDEQAPEVRCELVGGGDVVRADSVLRVELRDDIGVHTAAVEGAFGSGPGAERVHFPLPIEGGEFELGQALQQGRVDPAGRAGRLRVVVHDLAGNRTVSEAIEFARADVTVPRVTAVLGPAGGRQLARLGDRLRFRVQLDRSEPGCSLRVHSRELPGDTRVPLELGAAAGVAYHAVELPAEPFVGSATEALLRFSVEDEVGNVAGSEFLVPVVDRSPEVVFAPRAAGDDAGPGLWLRRELVIGPAGHVVEVQVGSSYRIAARLDPSAQLQPGDAVVARQLGSGSAELRIAPLLPGAYTLTLSLTEPEGAELPPIERVFAVRVLPEQITVRRPASEARYLPQLIDAGVLAQTAAGVGSAICEGPGWRIDADLRPYLTGELWVGADAPTPLPVRAESGTLLPSVEPVPGLNRLEVDLRDVLGRPVALQTSLDEGAPPAVVGRQRIAEFWWSDVGPELVGEQVLVEFGQPARFRLRMPLPLAELPTEQLKLGIPNREVPAASVVDDGGRSVLVFELAFGDWSAAAQLTGVPRAEFAKGVARSIDAYVATPAGRHKVSLALRTTRSTLSRMLLGELEGVPPGLGDLELVPVLAPDRAYAEPIPPGAPPRFTFRPQFPTSVRNMSDIMLQTHEFTWGEARALAKFVATVVDPELRARCVHAADAIGRDRLDPAWLLPAQAIGPDGPPPDDAVLVGVDFFQAWTLSRVLGLAVARDPELFRLPLGCELELAAFGLAEPRTRDACHGASARGGAVHASAFRTGQAPTLPWTPARTRELGDFVPTGYGVDIVGLDFGVREWVLDLPHMSGAEMLLKEWTGDHAGHLRRVLDMARGEADPPPDPLGLQARLGVVRGLAFGQQDGCIDGRGRPLDLADRALLPAIVPGVLRSEQLRRDGHDLIGDGREPRLAWIGFRVAGDAEALARLWGNR